jgi:hypothetical protein
VVAEVKMRLHGRCWFREDWGNTRIPRGRDGGGHIPERKNSKNKVRREEALPREQLAEQKGCLF